MRREFLLVILIIYLIVVFIIPTYRTFKKTAISPVVFGKEDNAHNYNGKVFIAITLLEFGSVFLYSFFENLYQYLNSFNYLESINCRVIGFLLITFSFIWVIIAQYQMANSWRIGIDDKNDSKLITKGLFGISRNPIFLSIVIVNLGLFLVIPNTIMLVVLTLSVVSLNTQIRLEEEFLKEKHGESYEKYIKEVRRWI